MFTLFYKVCKVIFFFESYCSEISWISLDSGASCEWAPYRAVGWKKRRKKKMMTNHLPLLVGRTTFKTERSWPSISWGTVRGDHWLGHILGFSSRYPPPCPRFGSLLLIPKVSKNKNKKCGVYCGAISG